MQQQEMIWRNLESEGMGGNWEDSSGEAFPVPPKFVFGRYYGYRPAYTSSRIQCSAAAAVAVSGHVNCLPLPLTEVLPEKDTSCEESAPPETTNIEQKKSKIKSRITGVLFYSFLILAIAAAFIFGNNGAPRAIGGYSLFSVLTESMQSEIPKGSLVIVKQVPVGEISLGDDITFLRQDNSTVTHRVVEIFENYEGRGIRAFRTQGIENSMPDKEIVYEGNVVGVVIKHFSGVGKVSFFIRENIIYVSVSVVIIIMLAFSLRVFFSTGKTAKKPAKQGK